jgi:UDP-N-acetyl-D-glucosamine dehydrogenase
VKQALIQKFQDKSAVIGIVGLGYVGLPLVLRFTEAGYPVVGLDIDRRKTERLSNGESYIDHIPHADVAHARDAGFLATTDFGKANDCDALIICVPTPLGHHREPDLSFVVSTIEALQPHLRPGQVLSLESTTYPGTTDEEILPRVNAAGLHVGKDFFLVYSPEREDPGNTDFTTRSIPKICGGITSDCLDVGIALYSRAIDTVVPVSSTRVAELTKLLENIHRAVNIGLVNEMKIVADRLGIDIHEVIRAAATKPFGFVPYYPGPGLGGHCIPIDPFYLTWKAHEVGVHTRFIELAGEINNSMPDYVVGKIGLALNSRQKALKGSRILVLGLAYKKNVDDMRESPSVILMEKLQALGVEVAFSDPYFARFPEMREHNFDLESVDLTPCAIADFDCVVVATDHDSFDYELLLDNAQLLVDTRGRYLEPHPKVMKA